jgi:hypothetical protein
MATLVDDILSVLNAEAAKYKGVTFSESTGNKFTLLDTPRLWDTGPTVTRPIQAGEDLLQEIQFTVGFAGNLVDIAVLWETQSSLFGPLGLPDGEFKEALSAGFRGIWQKPLVRIIVGVPTPVIVRTDDVIKWLTETIELHGNQKVGNVQPTIQVARTHQSLGSWNHAKIVAADGKRAVVGGHNQWDGPHLGPNPVHDVSGLFEGPAAASAHAFCSAMWDAPWGEIVILQNGKFSTIDKGIKPNGPLNGAPPPDPKGTSRMLGLGRLGFGVVNELTLGTNASVSARIMAMCKAKSTIRISQQSLFFQPGWYDFYTCLAIVRAIRAGVRVEIVVSNEVPLSDGGYRGFLTKTVEYLAQLYIGDRLGILAFPYANPPATI